MVLEHKRGRVIWGSSEVLAELGTVYLSFLSFMVI